MSLTFRTITVVEGPEINEWLERQEALDRAADDRDRVHWRAVYRLLGGNLPDGLGRDDLLGWCICTSDLDASHQGRQRQAQEQP